MALCSICASIPFSSPAPFARSHYDLTLTGLTYLHDVRYRGAPDPAPAGSSTERIPAIQQPEPPATTPLRPPSYSHHPSLDALILSAASGCPLCTAILYAAGKMRDETVNLAGRTAEARARMKRAPDFDAGFWVTGRVNGGRGVVVWTGSVEGESKPGKGRWFFPVVALGVCVEGNEEVGGEGMEGVEVRIGGPVGDSTLDFLGRRLGMCDGEGHEICEGSGDSALPRWLIDVRGAGGQVHIVDTTSASDDLEPGDFEYIALSYCDATGMQGRATLSDVPLNPARSASGSMRLDLEGLPVLFRDAVELTRQLAHHFLWIDALCIPDGLSESIEWRRSSENVANVYRHASLTLAASAATSVGDSLFAPRPKREVVEIPWHVKREDGKEEEKLVAETERLTLKEGFVTDAERLTQSQKRPIVKAFPLQLDREIINHYYISLRDTPLSHCAWPVAERVLSRRIIHVAPDQVYFECIGTDPGPITSSNGEEDKWVAQSSERGMFVSEDGLVLRRRSQSIYHGAVARLLAKTPGAEGYSDTEKAEAQDSWDALVRVYGIPAATATPADRAAGIAPLARLYSRILAPRLENEGAQDYIAGHFLTNLVQSLCWQGLGMQGDKAKKQGLNISALPALDAPSWSWTSFPGTAAGSFVMFSKEQIHPVITLDKVSVVPEDEADPFGPVRKGSWLQFEARAVELEIVPQEDVENEWSRKFLRLRSKKKGEGEGSSAGWDQISREYDESIETVEGMRLWAVLMVYIKREDDQSACKDGGCKPLPEDYRSLIVTETDEDGAVDGGLPGLRRLGWMYHEPEFFAPGELDERVTVRLV